MEIALSYSRSHAAFSVLILGLVGSCHSAFADDVYSPPAGYYSGATGTGTALKSQLTAAMSSGHILRSYGDFRNSASIHDRDPNNSSNILLVYNRASVSSNWDSGSTWNREHVWPQSLQPGSASNSTTGNLGDPHALRPSNPSINSSRGNKPFGGGAETTGNFRSLGSFYFPGDADKGDIARCLFYSETRYASSGITLVSGFPGANQMGDLDSLIAWHYLDAPDEFERRRNHAIYSATLNPSFRTNNRNAFIDHPEFVWSIYMNQTNDTTLWIGDLEPADGASTIDIDLGNILVGESIAPMSFTLNKSGNDGTYYEVTPSEGLTSSVEGCYNAFAMSTTGLTEMIELSVDAGATSIAGSFMGDLRIDNLDITTMGGVGNGANDIDDMVFVSFDVFNPGEASFAAGSDVNTINLDLGTIQMGAGDSMQSFTFFNLAAGGEFGAPIDIELISSVGDTNALSTNFSTISGLVASGQASIDAIIEDAAEGTFSATYTFRVYNDRVMFPGDVVIEDLVLTLIGVVESGSICIADITGDGLLNFFDVSAFLSAFSSGDLSVDLNDDGMLNFFDVSAFLSAFSAGCP